MSTPLLITNRVIRDHVLIPTGWNETVTHLLCAHCKHRFDVPQHMQGPCKWGANWIKSLQPVFEEIIAHVTSEHKRKHCQHCGNIVQRGRFKAHQRSIYCSIEQREAVQRSRGLVSYDLKPFLTYMAVLAQRVSVSLPWDDCDTREKVHQDLDEAKRLFRKLAGARPALTFYTTHYEPKGWREVDWVPELVAYGFDAIQKLYHDDEELRNQKAWEWLYMSDEEREAQLGGYELAIEAQSGAF